MMGKSLRRISLDLYGSDTGAEFASTADDFEANEVPCCFREKVDHPAHYNVGGIEVIDAIEAWGFSEGFNRGNAIKYIARAGRKDAATEIEDLEKAKWYIDAEIRRLKGEDKG